MKPVHRETISRHQELDLEPNIKIKNNTYLVTIKREREGDIINHAFRDPINLEDQEQGGQVDQTDPRCNHEPGESDQ